MPQRAAAWLAGWCVVTATAASAGSLETLFRTGFDGGEEELVVWDTEGSWQARKEALECEASRAASAVCYKVPSSRTLRAEATVAILRRVGSDGWAAAGLCIWQDGGNYWRLALAESPTGERYAELVEMREGRWQAQVEDALPAGKVEGKSLRWQTDRPYGLVVELGEEGIEGVVRDVPSGGVLARLGYRFEGRPAVREGRLALHQAAVLARWDDVVAAGPPAPEEAPLHLDVQRGTAGAAAVLDATQVGIPPGTAGPWRPILEDLGFGVTLLSPEDAAKPGVLTPGHFDLCVVPQTGPRPAGVAEALHHYLLAGGKALVCGGPAFGRPMWRAGRQWLDEERYRAAMRNASDLRALVTFDEEGDAEPWKAGGSDPGSTPRVSIDAAEAQRGKALRLDFADFAGWGSCARSFEKPFPRDYMLTLFSAKGGPGTQAMTVEWEEKDGSRWIASVALTPQWQQHILTPLDFDYWRDSKSTGRGGPQDHLRCENAAILRFGLAESHRPDLPRGKHVVWVDEAGTGASPLAVPPRPGARPRIELFSPPYKTHVLRDVVRVEAAPGLGLPALREGPPPGTAYSPVMRPVGRGFERGARSRCVRCLVGLDRQGRDRGALLSLLVHWRAPFPQAVWAYLGTAEPSFLAKKSVQTAIAEVIRRIVKGVFLLEGGTTEFAYADGEAPVLGARVANFGKKPFRGRCVIEVRGPRGKLVASEMLPLALGPGAVGKVSCRPRIAPAEGLFGVRVHLFEAQDEIDRIEHTFQFMPDLSRDRFVKVRDGNFWLGDERWHPVGINYWPRSCAGLEPHQYAAHWLAPASYDPDAVDEDLAHLARLGATMVSISTYDTLEARNLNDFLLRCRQLGLRVHLFVAGLDPLNGGPGPGLKRVEELALANNPVVFAYDIAWEPRFLGREGRFSWARFGAAWRQWIADEYGSVETAERHWGCRAPWQGNTAATPSLEQLRGEGNSALMIAAFHRFFYGHVGERYAQAARRLRAVDPNHLVSFRGQACAPPSARGLWPMHAPGALKAVDFVCPEGYGLATRGADRKTPWDDLRRGGLTTHYLRRASGGKPVLWVEFGAALYPNGTRWRDALLELPQERYEVQLAELMDWARLLTESGANGAAPWWFPGGFRTNEGSDWGLFHPDGTPRPACNALAEIARTIAAPRRKPDAWLEFDFDAHVFDSWPHYSDEYLKLLAAGKAVDVRLPGEGTDSTDCPAVGVGNVPWRGLGPARFLNAIFEEARVQVGAGEPTVWTGEAIAAKPEETITVTLIAANTGLAAWVDAQSAAGKPGAVDLVVQAGLMGRAVPIDRRVPYLGEVAIGPVVIPGLPAGTDSIRFRMRAAGRGEFGTVLRLPIRRGDR